MNTHVILFYVMSAYRSRKRVSMEFMGHTFKMNLMSYVVIIIANIIINIIDQFSELCIF